MSTDGFIHVPARVSVSGLSRAQPFAPGTTLGLRSSWATMFMTGSPSAGAVALGSPTVNRNVPPVQAAGETLTSLATWMCDGETTELTYQPFASELVRNARPRSLALN